MIRIRRLVWDAWNVAHIARHQVTPDEVEEVCHGQHVEHEAYGDRIMLLGLTVANRLLSIVLEPEGEGVYYVVTARDASRRERGVYSNEQGGESE